MLKNLPFKDLFIKICTIGYYSGFYSSVKDKIWINGGHFEFSSKDDEENNNIYHVCIKCIYKCWEANDLSIQYICEVWNHGL